MTERKRVLILDDEPDFAGLVADVATALELDAVTTTTAKAFEAAYLAAPADVIVLDIVMPERDGIETVRWLIERGCRAQILIISGYNPTYARMAQMIGEARGGLAVTLLPKPIVLAELRKQLLRAADRTP